ncbi:MAG: hypothetical protein MJ239_04720 [Bacilli bacterium]|nr:hypothetical protein [Bacilli bacterium]
MNPEDNRPKKKPFNIHSYLRHNRTGEDIDMLREDSYEPQNGRAGSTKYKDDIDAA